MENKNKDNLLDKAKPKFRRLHFVGVDGNNHFAFGLAFEQELLIAINSGPGEFVINDSTFVDDRFVRDSKYLTELLREFVRNWLYDKDSLKRCFGGKIWVNPDLKKIEFSKKLVDI